MAGKSLVFSVPLESFWTGSKKSDCWYVVKSHKQKWQDNEKLNIPLKTCHNYEAGTG